MLSVRIENPEICVEHQEFGVGNHKNLKKRVENPEFGVGNRTNHEKRVKNHEFLVLHLFVYLPYNKLIVYPFSRSRTNR